MNLPYLKSVLSASELAPNRAIVLLPDIFIDTDYAAATARQLADKFGLVVYQLDYFYQLTGQANSFSPSDAALPIELMQELKGDDFKGFFHEASSAIKTSQPKLESLTVVGFCFGGRLAYVAGLEPIVKKIISFYGAGAHQSNYVDGKSPVEALAAVRASDSSLQVLSFYGTEDATIPGQDRETTQKAMQRANIDYTARKYKAGHAYFQPGRDNYDEATATKSWRDLEEFMGGA